MLKKFSLPRGTNDILPEEIPSWATIENTARQIFQIYGYKEIRTPAFEETELFVRSMGRTTDVVLKQMLNLSPQGQVKEDEASGTLSLRPEATASVARAYIQHNLDKKESLSKLFYIGPMFRGERPQKGRLRQFHQIGVETMGPDSRSPYLDAEVIALCIRLLQAFGLQTFRLKINTLGTPEDKESFSRYLRKQLQPRLKSLCDDCQTRFERNVFRILDCKNKSCVAVVDSVKMDYSYLSADSIKYFEQVKVCLESLGIPHETQPRLVRGLDYYTQTVFEISDTSLGSQDALGAGGRYNNLVKQLGGPDVDAVGFALGVERILLASQKEIRETSTLDAFLVALDEVSLKKCFSILHILRQEGIACDMSYRLSSVKAMMRQADKRQARFVLLMGEDEYKNDVISLKNMQTGFQEKVDIRQNDVRALIQKIQQKG